MGTGTPGLAQPYPLDGFVMLGEAVREGSGPAAADGISKEDPDAREPEPLPRAVVELEVFLASMEPIRPEQVVLALGGDACTRMAGRAAFLGLLPAARAAALASRGDWKGLLGSGLSAAQLEMLAGAETWLSPVRRGRAFCQWLVERGALEEASFEALCASSLQLGAPLLQVAVERGVLPEPRYLAELLRFSGLRRARAPRGFARSLLVSFPVGWVEHFDLVPLRRRAGACTVAVTRPLPASLLQRLVADTQGPVEPCLAAPSAVAAWRRGWLRRWWQLHYPGRFGV